MEDKIHLKIDNPYSGITVVDYYTKSYDNNGEITDWYIKEKEGDVIAISGQTNNSYNNRYVDVGVSGETAEKKYISPRMKLSQHKKPNSYELKATTIRKKSDTEESTNVTVSVSGERVVVSSYAIINGDENRIFTNPDYFDYTITDNTLNITPIGLAHQTGDRIEWIFKIGRNDSFSTKSCKINITFTDDNKKKTTQSIIINQEQRQHVYTDPVLILKSDYVEYGGGNVDFEAYYTMDSKKMPLNEVYTSDTHYCTVFYDTTTCKGRVVVMKNYTNDETATDPRQMEIIGSGNGKYVVKTIWQGGFIPKPETYDYNFIVEPYDLDLGKWQMINGIKTWTKHIPYNSNPLNVKVVSQKVYEDRVEDLEYTVDVIDDGIINDSFKDSVNSRFVIHTNDYDNDVETNSERSTIITFIQSESNMKFAYKLIQLDKYSHLIYEKDVMKSEPQYYLITLGSDLLTGKGLELSANITSGSGAKMNVGDGELGDTSNMNLCWGGPSTNNYANQYLSFNPSSYVKSNSDVSLKINAKTELRTNAKGVISAEVKSFDNKPILTRSSRSGVMNVILPNGTPRNTILCHSKLTDNNSTHVLTIVRYYSDGSVFVRQVPSKTPQNSLAINQEEPLFGNQYPSLVVGTPPSTFDEVADVIYGTVNDSIISKLEKNNNTLSLNSSMVSFNGIELYYNSTEYRLVAIGTKPKDGENISYNNYYVFEDLSGLTWDITTERCHFIFEDVNELENFGETYIERDVYFKMFNQIVHNGLMACAIHGFKGNIYDPVTKKTTEYVITDAANLVNNSISYHKIRWKDISNHTEDASRNLKILSMVSTSSEPFENDKIYDNGGTWLFKGFGLSRDSKNLPTVYTKMSDFSYPFNSSTPVLCLGFDEVQHKAEDITLRFGVANLINVNNLLGYQPGGNPNYYFDDGDMTYVVYEWKDNSKAPNYYKLFISHDTSELNNLNELYRGTWSYAGFSTWKFDERNPDYKNNVYGVNEITFPNTLSNKSHKIIIYFELKDMSNVGGTLSPYVRLICACSTDLNGLANYPCIMLDGNLLSSDYFYRFESYKNESKCLTNLLWNGIGEFTSNINGPFRFLPKNSFNL